MKPGRKRIILAAALAVLLAFTAGCGGGDTSVSPKGAPSAQESGPPQTAEGDGTILKLQDPGAFLHGAEPDKEGKNDDGFLYKAYVLKPEEDVLALQYAELLQSGAHGLEKTNTAEDESDTARVWACYFRYTGEADLPVWEVGDGQCNVFVGVRRDNGEKTTFAVYYPEGVDFADWGARADRSKVDSAPADTLEPTLSPDPASDAAIRAVRYLSPSAFLHDLSPSTDREIGNGATEQVFVLEKGMGALGRQYVNILMSDLYGLKLIAADETVTEKVVFEYYYLQYGGSKAVGTVTVNGTTCHLCVRVSNYENRNETHIQVLAADGFQTLDTGERADKASLNTDKPVPAIPERPTPSGKPKPTGPSVIPDFLAHDPSGAFRAGTSAFGNAVCFLADDNTYYYAAEAYVQLLVDMGYKLTGTDEKVARTYSRMQWNLYYEGADWPTIEESTHVRVKHLAKSSDGRRSTEISIGYAEGITYGGEEQYQGGGGGGSSGGSWDPYTPDTSKLPCLTCKGSGSCTTCGGDGYTGFGDAKAGCRSCHGNGNCRTCNGSGTR